MLTLAAVAILTSGQLKVTLVAKAGPNCQPWGQPFAFSACTPRYFGTGFGACRLSVLPASTWTTIGVWLHQGSGPNYYDICTESGSGEMST